MSLPERLLPFATTIPVLDQGFVELVDVLGDEQSILQAARVTTGSQSKGAAADRGLLRYLIAHRHTTPLEFCEIVLRIRIPMDAWRQYIRHRTASVNEYSTRYSVAIDEMATTAPDEWRAQAESNRQGSSGTVTEWPEGYKRSGDTLSTGRGLRITGLNEGDAVTPGAYLSMREHDFHGDARELYKERLTFGVAREQARKDLPLSTFTEAYWKIDLHNLLHFLGLRLDPHAQLEIRLYAETIANIVKVWVPNVWEAFCDYQLHAATFSAQEMEGLRQMVASHRALWQSCHASTEAMIPTLTEREADAFFAKLGLPPRLRGETP